MTLQFAFNRNVNNYITTITILTRIAEPRFFKRTQNKQATWLYCMTNKGCTAIYWSIVEKKYNKN